MIKECLVCGSSFTTYHSKILLGRGKYCSKECCLKNTSFKGNEGIRHRFEKGKHPSFYKGWRYSVARKGGKPYKQLFMPDSPMSDKSGYVREHRHIASLKIGRNLLSTEVVHHIDGDTLNNNPNNLQVMDKRDHDRMNIYLNIHKNVSNHV